MESICLHLFFGIVRI